MNVVMPQLGETVNEGTIAVWHKAVGESVAKGDVLVDVETDKVAMEIEAPAAGTLTAIEVAQGETVEVGVILAVIDVAGEADEAKVEKAPVASADTSGDDNIATKPAAGGLSKRSSGKRYSPVVRRLIKQHDLDISQVSGTGRNGRVTRRDVDAFMQSGAGAKAAMSSPVASVAGQTIPFDRVRKVTADHMVRSKATSPHVLQTIDVDFHRVDKSRLARKVQWKAQLGFSLSYLPYVARAVCLAIADFPKVNASVVNESLVVHAHVNLSIAIDLNHEGLLAAVVRNASSMSVSQLAIAFNDLVTRAKSKKLTADDLQGGTYTLSNPGPFGTLFTAPIINQPQVGILSMDAVKKRPHVIETADGDSIGIRPVGILAHSFDHRAIDGAYSGAYLQRLKSLLEESDWDSEW